jgi:hypothetical protein
MFHYNKRDDLFHQIGNGTIVQCDTSVSRESAKLLIMLRLIPDC